MPLFGYICTDCETEFEALVRSNEKPACTHCGSKHLQKQMSHFATTSATPDPVGCGAPSCCRMQGGGCMN